MTIDTEQFRVIEKDGLRLIMPQHSAAVSNAGWTKENLWCRSRVETLSGDTISQGFGKFFNVGQGPDGLRVDLADIVKAVKDGERVVATLKYDGSCLIRSVHKGKVTFRTRGSLSYEFHDKAVEELEVFRERYPELFNPTWYSSSSLLFEWVTPDAQIVIKYDKPELYLIGGVDHGHRHISHLGYFTVSRLEDVSSEFGIPMMEYFVINSVKDWYNFYHEVVDHKKIEGYVIRLGDDEHHLVKIKAMPYLTKHGLKSNLSFKSMVEFWLQHDQCDSIIDQLESMYDEEVVEWAMPFVLSVLDAVEKWESVFADTEKNVSERRHWPRKDFAIEMQTKIYKDQPQLFALAMILWQDKEVPDRIIRNYLHSLEPETENEV